MEVGHLKTEVEIGVVLAKSTNTWSHQKLEEVLLAIKRNELLIISMTLMNFTSKLSERNMYSDSVILFRRSSRVGKQSTDIVIRTVIKS
jgi:hypothetical protein